MGLMALSSRRPGKIFFSAGSAAKREAPIPRRHPQWPAQNPSGPGHQLRALPDPGPSRATPGHPGPREPPRSA